MDSEDKASAKAGGFSFSFSKKKESKPLQKAAFKDIDIVYKDETEYIQSSEGLQNKPKMEEEPLVIPLIQTNKWKPALPEDLEKDDIEETDDKKENTVTRTGDSVTDLALQELLHGSSKNSETEDIQIPLLMKNKVPDGFETDDRLDVSLRPDGAEGADYDAVPIEQYGMAMLRGMGWKDGQGVGKNHKAVKPVQAILRPKGMGLGADKSKVLQAKKGNTNSKENKDEEELEWKSGAFCIVENGRHEGLYGQVEGIDPDEARVIVKLTIGGKIVTLSQFSLKLVTKKDYDKCSKYLNKAKADKYKKDQEDKLDRRSSDHDSDHSSHKHKSKHKKDKSRDRHRENGSSRHSDRDSDDSSNKHRHKDKKRKHRDEDYREKKHTKGEDSRSSHKSSSQAKPWLRANLRVRMVDPNYKKGKYFKSKVIIEDVVSFDSCICRTQEGKVLEDICQSQLETVIPRHEPAYVSIVSGKNKGELGEILQKDKAACSATIQLLSDRDVLVTLSYDSICEYVGDISDFDV